MRTLWLQDSIKDAIDAPRIHHQLFPNVIVHEHTFPQVNNKLQVTNHQKILLKLFILNEI
jgi:gamma-glutamyltranspeptidase